MFASVSILARCSVLGCMVAKKLVSRYAGAYSAIILNTWHGANERYPRQQSFFGPAYDDAPSFVKTRELSWSNFFSRFVTKHPSSLPTAPKIPILFLVGAAGGRNQSLPVVSTWRIVIHAAGNGIHLQTKGQYRFSVPDAEVFLNFCCATGSAFAIIGRGFLRRNPS